VSLHDDERMFQEKTELQESLSVEAINVEDYPGGLAACLEAILISADQPQSEEDLARLLQVDEQQVKKCLAGIASNLERETHGFCLKNTARGWYYASQPALRDVVQLFITDAQSSHLSQAALEVLAVVAYKQPITRSKIAAIRGVNSDGIVRSLVIRGLVKEEGIDSQTRATTLVTTSLFLEKMGVHSVDELPSLAPFLPEESSALKEIDQQSTLSESASSVAKIESDNGS
jgi:segregation and condensation protein B